MKQVKYFFFIVLLALTFLQTSSAHRYFNSVIGRWTTPDPHQDKYPSLSPYSYAADNPLKFIDVDGKDIIIVHAPNGAHGMGHAAVLIGNDNVGWTYYSKDGGQGTLGWLVGKDNFDQGRTFSNLEEFSKTVNFEAHREGKPYTDAYRITSTEEQDNLMKTAAIQAGNSEYVLAGQSCIDLASDALKAGGFNPGTILIVDPNTGMVLVLTSPIPNQRMEQIKNNNPGVDVSKQLIQPPKKDDKKKQQRSSVGEDHFIGWGAENSAPPY